MKTLIKWISVLAVSFSLWASTATADDFRFVDTSSWSGPFQWPGIPAGANIGWGVYGNGSGYAHLSVSIPGQSYIDTAVTGSDSDSGGGTTSGGDINGEIYASNGGYANFGVFW